MKKRNLLLSLGFSAILFSFNGCTDENTTIVEEEEEIHFSYSGENAPINWGNLKEDWMLCNNGIDKTPVEEGYSHQSPINFVSKNIAKDGGFIFDNNRSLDFVISNNGHTIVLTPDENSQEKDILTINNKAYTLKQFHFHSLSEHTEGNNHSDMEIHFVNIADDGSIAVIGAFIDSNDTSINSELSKIFEIQLPEEGNNGSTVSINIHNILPKSKIYNYSGSLTTPPCTEEVEWNIYVKHIGLSTDDVEEFKEKYNHNYRPITGNMGSL